MGNGWCGNSAAHKAAQTTTKYEYKAGCECPGEIATDMKCGPENNDQICPKDYPYCNSRNGWCGNTAAHKAAQTTTKYEYKAGCARNSEEAVGLHYMRSRARAASRAKASTWKFLETNDRCEVKTDEECSAGEKQFFHNLKGIYYCCDLSLEQSLSNPLPEEVETGSVAEQALSFNALAETANPKLIENVTYVFAAIGFFSMLYVGVKRGSKAFCQGDYAEV